VFRPHPRIERTRQGDFRVRLPEAEREVLRAIPAQLREVVGSKDPVVFRLFPPAYPNDEDRNDEYDHLVHDDLVQERLTAAAAMEDTLDADRLSEEQLTSWLGVVNDARLVLGTRLDVTEETYERDIPEHDPNAPAYAMYFYLGWLQEQIVAALAG
jgi:hypothetical protein